MVNELINETSEQPTKQPMNGSRPECTNPSVRERCSYATSKTPVSPDSVPGGKVCKPSGPDARPMRRPQGRFLCETFCFEFSSRVFSLFEHSFCSEERSIEPALFGTSPTTLGEEPTPVPRFSRVEVGKTFGLANLPG